MRILLTLVFTVFYSFAVASAGDEKFAQETAIDVYKSEHCGCCNGWIDHLDKTGFQTNPINHTQMNGIKDKFGIHPKLRSCHTGVAGNYVFEGHVPPISMKQFLDNPPPGAIGLSVPGMPIGSAGMEDGDRFQAYKVWLMNKDGTVEEFASINSYEDQF